MMGWLSSFLGRIRDDELDDSPPVSPVLGPIDRARLWVGKGRYALGGGDYRPHVANGQVVDEPWTQTKYGLGSDCVGFAFSYCHRVPRHRPGFNRGGNVVDWVNTDSLVDDAFGAISSHSGTMVTDPRRELVEPADYPWPGTLLVYASVRDRDGKRTEMGHIAIVESCSIPFGAWDPEHPVWNALTVIQSRGPNGKRPGVVRSNAMAWIRHDSRWGLGEKPWRRSRLLQVVKP